MDGYYSINPWNGMVKNDFPLIIDALFWYLNKHENINIIKKLRIRIPNANNYINSSDKNDNRDMASPLKLNMIYRPQDGVKIRLNENSRVRAIYQQEYISERHRHRYDVNNIYSLKLVSKGQLYVY